jgi:hypothetical protein
MGIRISQTGFTDGPSTGGLFSVADFAFIHQFMIQGTSLPSA